MKKRSLLLLICAVMFCVCFGSVSARDLMINPQEFYDKFCRIASETYGGRFCTSGLSESAAGYSFKTSGGFTVELQSFSLKKDMSKAILRIPLSASLQSSEALTAMYAHFLTADNNIFASESTFSQLDRYVRNISLNMGKEFKYDRIRILSEKGASGYRMTAYN